MYRGQRDSVGWGHTVGAVLVRLVAAARKTDKIACDLLSRGLLGEDALEAAASTVTGERDPGLKAGCALCTALNPAPSSSRTWLLLCWFFVFFSTSWKLSQEKAFALESLHSGFSAFVNLKMRSCFCQVWFCLGRACESDSNPQTAPAPPKYRAF